MKKTDREFEQICSFIRNRRNEAIGFLNYATVSTYWTVGAYVSRRIKSNSWGAGTVQEFEDYIKTRHPNLRGYGRRQIYNMVGFYEAYSSLEFGEIFMRLKLDDFVLKWADEFVQPAAAQLLVIACSSFDSAAAKAFPNIKVKKIPQMLLKRCEFGKTDYALNIVDGGRGATALPAEDEEE